MEKNAPRPWIEQYEKHVPHSIHYPDIPIHRVLTDTAAAHPDYIAMTFNDVHTSYKDLNVRVNRFAHALTRAGAVKGDRIAFVLVNSPAYVIAFFAVMKIGAIVVNLSVGLQGDELAHCLNDSGAKIAVTLDIFAQNIYKVIRETGVKSVILHSVMGLEKKLSLEQGEPVPLMFLDLIANAPSGEEPGIDVSPEDVAVLQYTSGSTGIPKAATLTHANIVASLTQSDAWAGIEKAGNRAVICIIPFFHVFGMLACLLISAKKGYRMLLMPRFDLMDILSLEKLLEVYRPISFPAVPSLWAAILTLPPDVARQRLSSVQVASSGGAPLPASIQEAFERFTGRRIMEAYGLSEASSATHMNPYPSGGPVGSIGLPLPDTIARIMDIETGQRECGADEVGELVIKGPQIMRGYWNNPELTARALRDGWLYTGDLARMDSRGFFYLVDRKDDMIISSGFNIYPSQIEGVLKQHPKVKDAAVISAPDRVKGQSVIAIVVLKEGAHGDKEEFVSYCRENMPDYRVPKAILIRDQLPRDPTGKLLRRIMREEVRNL